MLALIVSTHIVAGIIVAVTDVTVCTLCCKPLIFENIIYLVYLTLIQVVCQFSIDTAINCVVN